MKAFMSNTCMHSHCKGANYKQCLFYTPTCFGVKVPRWLGNLLFKFEWWLLSRNIKNKF